MQTDLQFKIVSHMTMENKSNLQSHGRPSLFATWVTVRTTLTYNHLVTIEFEDPTILQQRKGDSLTDFHAVILAEQTEEDLMLSLWAAKEHTGLLIAMQYRSGEAVEISDRYKEFVSDRKLTEAEIKEIFDYIFADPSVIYPIELAVGAEQKDDIQKLPA